ncbi:MAG TPA: hypothetical protein GX530_09840 [Corynebacteriales bacterium]|jgi:peptidoglycan hydrolase CwlO-like protein|nr:hypothetical protein [Mycobacteriales bacterium]
MKGVKAMSKSSNTGTPPPPSPLPRESKRHYLFISLIVAAWVLMVVGGFYAGKLYIDRCFETVQQTNAIHVQELENRMDSLAAEVDEIELALQDADQTLASSSSTQENLNQKIENLDQQLQQLAKSLNILKEAP